MFFYSSHFSNHFNSSQAFFSISLHQYCNVISIQSKCSLKNPYGITMGLSKHASNFYLQISIFHLFFYYNFQKHIPNRLLFAGYLKCLLITSNNSVRPILRGQLMRCVNIPPQCRWFQALRQPPLNSVTVFKAEVTQDSIIRKLRKAFNIRILFPEEYLRRKKRKLPLVCIVLQGRIQSIAENGERDGLL